MAFSSSNQDNFDASPSFDREERSPDMELAALVARDLQRYVTDRMSSLGSRASAWTGRVGVSTLGAAERGGEEMARAYAGAKQYVRKKPVQSVAGTFALGALIGLLTRD